METRNKKLRSYLKKIAYNIGLLKQAKKEKAIIKIINNYEKLKDDAWKIINDSGEKNAQVLWDIQALKYLTDDFECLKEEKLQDVKK